MQNQRLITRRSFLRSTRNSLLTACVASVSSSLFLNRTRAATGENPSEFIRLGFIGVGNQGNNNLRALIKNAVAVCDVDKSRVAAARKKVEDTNSRPCAGFSDYRKLLEEKSIDAVVITTPDHWHTLPALHACEAGKDVYCEKPMTLFVSEGQALIKAVRRHNRVFQTGSQQRSDSKFRRACEYVRSGRIGKVTTVKVGLPGVNFEKKGEALVVPDTLPPAELDFDFWLGPAPLRAYNKNRCHYLFRFFWDYSGGQMTNWGAHHLDIVQWGLGTDASGPVEIEGSAVYHPDRVYETPQKFDVSYKYAGGTVVLCSSGTGKYKGGSLFEGEKGKLFVTRGAIESDPEDILEEPLDASSVKLYQSADHYANFLQCIKSRQDPICTVEIGHRSATICHLGNIAIRTGKKVLWDPKAERITGDDALTSWLNRPYRAPWQLPT